MQHGKITIIHQATLLPATVASNNVAWCMLALTLHVWTHCTITTWYSRFLHLTVSTCITDVLSLTCRTLGLLVIGQLLRVTWKWQGYLLSLEQAGIEEPRCYYDTLTIKLHVWNVYVKKYMYIYKLLFSQYGIYWVEGIWYMYLYNGLLIFKASKCDQHTHYTQKLVWFVFQITYIVHVYIEYLYLVLYIRTEYLWLV